MKSALQQTLRAARWLAILLPMAAAVGSACALFLWSLDHVTQTRTHYPWLLFLLPVAGFAVGLVYQHFGRSAAAGSNLILEQIHQAGGGVPRRMAPLILISTLVTHLFGGSAGREGTAIQMGGSIASTLGRILSLENEKMRILLMAGIAAGFGAVFGTPLAGAIFALEVLVIGRIEYDALVPCLTASVAADWVCRAWGIEHTHFQFLATETARSFDPWLLAKVVVAAVAFGCLSAAFAGIMQRLTALFQKFITYAPLRPLVGGAIVVALVFLLNSSDYLGLGVASPNPQAVTLVSFFQSAEIHPWSWFWKLLFTVVTLSSGFKGGEVTPLFFIGAAAGNAMAGILGAPPDLLAALGLIAVFAGATNTPLACTLLGVELFGATHLVYFAIACFLAYLFSGHSGIYHAQRLAVPKTHAARRKLTPS